MFSVSNASCFWPLLPCRVSQEKCLYSLVSSPARLPCPLHCGFPVSPIPPRPLLSLSFLQAPCCFFWWWLSVLIYLDVTEVRALAFHFCPGNCLFFGFIYLFLPPLLRISCRFRSTRSSPAARCGWRWGALCPSCRPAC